MVVLEAEVGDMEWVEVVGEGVGGRHPSVTNPPGLGCRVPGKSTAVPPGVVGGGPPQGPPSPRRFSVWGTAGPSLGPVGIASGD